MLLMALAGTTAAGWTWGLAGAGLTMAMLASGSIGYLARRRPMPSAELGPPLLHVITGLWLGAAMALLKPWRWRRQPEARADA